MRRVHGSRRAEIVEEASPPNSGARRGSGVGTGRTSPPLSAGDPVVALSAYDGEGSPRPESAGAPAGFFFWEKPAEPTSSTLFFRRNMLWTSDI